MLTQKQILARSLFVAFFMSFVGGPTPASAQAINEFDQKQSDRFSLIQESISSKKFERKIAQDRLVEVNAELEAYGALGPNQKKAISYLAAEKIKKDILKILEEAVVSGEEGYGVDRVANEKTQKRYGIILVSDGAKWKAEIAGTNQQEIEANKKKFVEAVSEKVVSNWKDLGEKDRELIGARTLRGLNAEIKDLVPEDGKLSASFKENVEKKVKSFGDESLGRIRDLEKNISAAKLDDQSEKRLLLAEKKTYEFLEKKEGESSVEDLCKEFAGNGLTKVDLNRRRSALEGKSDPCDKSLSVALGAEKELSPENLVKAEGSFPNAVKTEGILKLDPSKATPVISDEPHKEQYMSGKNEDVNDEEKENNPNSSLSNGKIRKQNLSLNSNEEKKLKETNPIVLKKLKELETERNQLMGAIDSRSRQDLINACNQAASNLKKSIGLGSDNEKNEKIVSSITDKLEKTLAKGYQGLVCDKSGANDGVATYSSMEEASKDVLKGLGIPPSGPLTQSKQNTLESLSKGAMEVAANFANQRRNRTRLDYQMLEAASKKALSRITTENPNLVDTNTLNYLRTLSYNELMGSASGNPELDMMNGGTGGGLLTNFLPSYALQTYQNYFDIALMDIKQKNGIREEFDKQAECALAFAQAATQRWSEEEDRKGLLGARVRGSSSSGLPVNNGPAVRNEESTRKVERNR